jgi:predicted nucleotidyltransferase
LKIKDVVNKALKFCVEKSSAENTTVIKNLIQENDGAVNSTFRYALGKEICRFLCKKYEEIDSCYMFGSSLSDTAKITSDIDLIIKVKRKSRKLTRVISGLDSKVLNYFKSNMNGNAKGLKKILDVYFVDALDVKRKIGFGSVVSSLHTPPIKIVEKNEKEA